MTFFLRDELFSADGTLEPLLDERISFDFGGDVVGRDEPPLPTAGTPHASANPRLLYQDGPASRHACQPRPASGISTSTTGGASATTVKRSRNWRSENDRRSTS